MGGEGERGRESVHKEVLENTLHLCKPVEVMREIDGKWQEGGRNLVFDTDLVK